MKVKIILAFLFVFQCFFSFAQKNKLKAADYEIQSLPFNSKSDDFGPVSDGQVGLGGLDIFYTEEKAGIWMPPHNLGAPINSKWDDHSLIINSSNDFGYFVSNRSGGVGGDDIYSFKKNSSK